MEMHAEFSEEMRLQLQRHMDSVREVKKSAKNLMGVSAIIFFIIAGLDRAAAGTGDGLLPDMGLHTFGFAWVITIVVLGILIDRMGTKRVPFLARELLDDLGGSKKFELWIKQGQEEYYGNLIREYIWCLKSSEEAIRSMTRLLSVSIGTFAIGIGGIALALILHAGS